ncbi:hypothetical protein BU23DRAFT_410151, partial [Bimuria novae-zelandiae CBS 107.79]
KIFKYKARGITNKILSLETYVAKITTYLRYTKPHSIGLAVSATKLRITTPASQPAKG